MKRYCVSCWKVVETAEPHEEIIYPCAVGARGAVTDLAPRKVKDYAECPDCGYPTIPLQKAYAKGLLSNPS